VELIYFAPVSFSSYWQRPHYMIDYLLNHGFSQVYWIDPYPTRLPRLSDMGIKFQSAPSVATRCKGVKVIRLHALPFEPLPVLWHLNRLLWQPVIQLVEEKSLKPEQVVIGIGRPTRLALSVLTRHPELHSFFDVMDDYSAFYTGLSKHSMRQVEFATACRAKWLFCSSPKLVDKYQQFRSVDLLLQNGYPMASLPRFENCQMEKPPVIGYVGTIASWFDWPLVIRMAQALPAVSVHIVGPVRAELPEHLPSNIRFFPECSKNEAISHTMGFRVGIIPFQCNTLTDSVDPIKFYEMMALGVPVWSTGFGTMSGYIHHGMARHIDASTEWPILYERTCAEHTSRPAVIDFRRRYDWSSRFSELSELISKDAV